MDDYSDMTIGSTLTSNPDYFTIDMMKKVGMWPLLFLSAFPMIPYLNRIKSESIVGVEIGVLKGETSYLLLENCSKITKLYGIDPYKEYVDVNHKKEQWQMDTFRKVAEKNLNAFGDRYELIDKTSDEACANFTDSTLDFILIDGLHEKDQVKKDLANYYPKLKNGGFIFVHDYNNPEVNLAVKEWRLENRVSNPIHTTYNFIWFWNKADA